MFILTKYYKRLDLKYVVVIEKPRSLLPSIKTLYIKLYEDESKIKECYKIEMRRYRTFNNSYYITSKILSNKKEDILKLKNLTFKTNNVINK